MKIKLVNKLVNLKKNLSILYIANHIYGISYTKFSKLIIKLGFNNHTKIKHLPNYKIELLVNILNFYIFSKNNINLQENYYLTLIQKINNYKAKRHRRGLPVRGQRTWSNAKSARSKAFFKNIQNILKKEKFFENNY